VLSSFDRTSIPVWASALATATRRSSRGARKIGGLLVVAEKIGDRRRAYDEVFTKIIEMNAVVSMPDLYEVDRLEKFEDPFEAFKEYNFGLFDGEKNFPIDEFVDNGNHFRFRVQRCSQAELARDFGVDELGELGCDHDTGRKRPRAVTTRTCNFNRVRPLERSHSGSKRPLRVTPNAT